MTEGTDLHNLIFSIYQPQLIGKATSIESERLLSNSSLSLDELLVMQNSSVHLKFVENFQKMSTLYLVARIANAALQSSNVDNKSFTAFQTYIEYIQVQEKAYSIEKDIHKFIGKLSSALFASDSISEMKNLFLHLQKLKTSVKCLEAYENESLDKYTVTIKIYNNKSQSNTKELQFSVAKSPEETVNPNLPALTAEPSFVTNKNQLSLNSLPIHAQNSGRILTYVLKGSFHYQGQECKIAAKEYHSDNRSNLMQSSDNEYKILNLLSQKKPCFLICYGSYSTVLTNNKFCFGMVMELCNMTLMNFINDRKEHNAPLTEQELYPIVYHLIDGFEFMEQHRIYHLDIKPHNIFITHDWKLKIADFNVAKIYTSAAESTNETSLRGTDGYMPPEIQLYSDERKFGNCSNSLRYDASKVDVYSLGLTLLQLYSLSGVNGLNKIENQGFLTERLENIQFLWFKNLLRNMLSFDYNQRMTMSQLKALLIQN